MKKKKKNSTFVQAVCIISLGREWLQCSLSSTTMEGTFAGKICLSSSEERVELIRLALELDHEKNISMEQTNLLTSISSEHKYYHQFDVLILVSIDIFGAFGCGDRSPFHQTVLHVSHAHENVLQACDSA